MNSDTIAAIATAPGEGAIGVIRVSGARAPEILAALFRSPTPASAFLSHRLYLGQIVNGETAVDQAMAVWMQAPRSFTGEDCVEFHCHGGTQLLKTILALILRSGARLARPGEFSERAFLNGKIDLAQAEAIAAMIRAKSDAALSLSFRQLAGQLSQVIDEMKHELVTTRAHLEAGIDFVEEEIAPQGVQALVGRLRGVLERTEILIASYERGRILREGLRVAIIGKPNVGKSSLLNALLKEERAIVDASAGTTRDFIEESFTLGGILIRIVDTAGIRKDAERIEALGIRHAERIAAQADLILALFDGSRRWDAEDDAVLAFLEKARAEHIYIRTKVDLPQQWSRYFPMSTHSQEGLHLLEQQLIDHARGGREQDAELCTITHLRHKDALGVAAAALKKTMTTLESGLSHEFAVSDLNTAIDALKEITGEITHEDILDKIFSEFCIGK